MPRLGVGLWETVKGDGERQKEGRGREGRIQKESAEREGVNKRSPDCLEKPL